ncbi:MAG: hemerythrin domain-containing protein [Magnetococcus sp. DMHC-6]
MSVDKIDLKLFQDTAIEDFRKNLFKRLRNIAVPQFQLEHEGLLEIIIEVYAHVKKLQMHAPEPGDIKALTATLDHLKQYAGRHFRSEEVFMEKNQFTELDIHRRAHQKFVQALLELEEKIHQKSVSYVIDLLHLVMGWLFDHINQMDTRYSKAFLGQSLSPAVCKTVVPPLNESKESQTSGSIFRDQLLKRLVVTGNTHIDHEHRQLLDQILNFHKFVENIQVRKPENADWKKVDHILDFLTQYCLTHFKHEENILKQHQYPLLNGHIEEHQKLISKLEELKKQLLKERNILFTVDLKFFLVEWFLQHTTRSDSKYKSYI